MRDDKHCVICGRTIRWRKAWAGRWDHIRRCSAACRRRRLGRTDRALQAAILALLAERAAGASVCPSEVARRVSPQWRPLMERTREAARRLVAEGAIEIVQRGRVVDPSTARGPIRLRLPRRQA